MHRDLLFLCLMTLEEVGKLRLEIDAAKAAESLEDLKKKSKEIRSEIRLMENDPDADPEALRELRRTLKEVNEEVKGMAKNVDVNNASMTELGLKSKQLHAELKNLKIGSEEWIDKLKEITEVDAKIADTKGEIKELTDQARESGTAWDRVKETFLGTFAAFSLDNIIGEVINFGKEGVASALKMSDAMSDIEKATDMTTEEVKDLVDNIKKIDTRTAVEDLTDIAIVAGQLGIAKNEVLGFVESVDKAVVALGDEFSGGAEEVAATIGGLQKLFKETKDMEAGKAINDIGSALNALGAAGSATGPVVADFTARMGQLGNLSPQISQTMGLGAAFQELGLTAEIASGGLSNIMLGASKATALYAEHLGMTEVAFKKMINNDPNAVIIKLAESFKGLPTTVVTKQLDDLGIKSQEATKVMSLLKDQTLMVQEKQKLAFEEMKKGTSLTDEFNKKNTNAAAEMAKMGKELKNLSTEIGQALLPILTKAGAAVITFVNGIRAVPQFIKENQVSLALLVIGLATFNAQLITSAAASLAVAAAEKARAIATNAMALSQTLLNAAMNANPIGAIIGALALLATGIVYAYNNSETFRGIVNGLWSALKTGVQAVGELWDVFTGWIEDVFERSAAYVKPFTDQLVSIWDSLMEGVDFLEKVGNAIKDYFLFQLELIGTVLSPIKTAVLSFWDLLGEGIDWLSNLGTSIKEYFIGSLQTLNTAIAPVRSTISSLWSSITQVIDSIKKFGSAVADFFKLDTLAKAASDAGKKIGNAFTSEYEKETTAGRQKDLANDKAHQDKKTDQAKAGAAASGAAAKDGNKKALDGIAEDTTTHHSKEQEKAQKAAKKSADSKAKANADALKQMEDDEIAAIADSEARALKSEEVKHTRRLKAIADSKADNAIKNQQIESENARHIAAVEKLEQDALKKKEKETAEMQKRLDDIDAKTSGDSLARKLKTLENKKDADIAYVEKSKLLEEEKEVYIKKINDQYRLDKETAEEKHRVEQEKKNREHRDKELKAEKQLFDSQFQIQVEEAKLALELTTTNSQAQFDAKLRLLKLEIEEKKQKLKWEADAEKARIAESIQDTEARKTAIEGIDARLKGSLALADAKFETDKTNLQNQANEARHKNNQEFFDNLNKLGQGDYRSFFGFITDKVREEKTHLDQRNGDHVSFGSAMKGLMTGDFSTFSTFLAQKTSNDTIFNSTRFQNFSKASEQIGQVATMAIDKLQQLNQKHLDSQLKKIEKEKKTQLDSWEEQYEKGLISKEDYEDGVEKINTEYKERELAEKKKAFEREKKLQMANALVAGALAFIKALASGFFPLNLVFAATTAVATGLQVAQISRQKFEARKGYHSNGGVPQGPRHGMKYGDSGIALVDRSTQQEIGEMEGGEPFMILSRNTYANNGEVIDKLLHSSLHQNGKPITLRRGGVLGVRESEYFSKDMYLFGSKKKKREAEAAAAAAQEEAEQMQAEAEAEAAAATAGYDANYTGDNSVDMSETNAQIAENARVQKQMADDMKRAADTLSTVVEKLDGVIGQQGYSNNLLGQIASKPAISAHDIYAAMDRVAAAVSKSNL